MKKKHQSEKIRTALWLGLMQFDLIWFDSTTCRGLIGMWSHRLWIGVLEDDKEEEEIYEQFEDEEDLKDDEKEKDERGELSKAIQILEPYESLRNFE